MSTTTIASDVRVWPSLSRAAQYLGVDKATLSRRSDLPTERVGQQELRLPPGVVVRLAREYRRRVVEEVAFDLIEHARTRDPDQVHAVEDEIDKVFADDGAPDPTETAAFLEMAQAYLPRDLYDLVLAAVSEEHAVSRGVVGHLPPSEADHQEPEHPAPRRRSRLPAVVRTSVQARHRGL